MVQLLAAITINRVVDYPPPHHPMKLFTRVLFTTVTSFNAHTILGLQKLATEKQIKRAYYSLAKQYHPDSNPGQDTSEQFQRVTKAYELMIKEAAFRGQRATRSQQKKYSSGRQQQGGGEGHEDKMFKAYQAYKRKNGIRTDSFHKFMEFYQDYTDQKKHERREKEREEQSQQQRPFEQNNEDFEEQEEQSDGHKHAKRQKNRNKKLELTVEVQLTAEQAKIGTERRLKLWKKVICVTCHGHPPQREVKCKKCHGSGVHVSKNEIGFCWSCGGNRTVSRSECGGCGGKGEASRQAEEVIHIKPGVANNQQLVIKGKGHQHHKKGYFGDLIVKIKILGCESETQEGSGFRKVGFNTFQTVKISVIEAVLGTKLKYNTVWGEKTLPMRGGVQDGYVIKRNGQGCRKNSHKDNGHHFITISVEIPMKISEQEMQIYERIRQIYKTHRSY